MRIHAARVRISLVSVWLPPPPDVLANELPLLEPDWIVFAALYGVDR